MWKRFDVGNGTFIRIGDSLVWVVWTDEGRCEIAVKTPSSVPVNLIDLALVPDSGGTPTSA